MKFEAALAAYREGKNIRRKCWSGDFHFRKSSYLAELTFRELTNLDIEGEDWQVIEEPKPPKLMAPAFFTISDGICVSGRLFESQEDARASCIGRDIKWPAIPNKDGFYELPQE